ncbi:hypothetical protein [Lignipirellula cremea]|uniref:Uncharacterized protein n=1 Tax=Lignipirellula cremea TaxID=2528010 RepID=A0A518DMG3_9BACT|nr:hypothetical protein [Lignipirellula cremea]QDU93027.1 hypothetical protein Pla8534_08020 [Lignipirellula cremea]
MLARNFLLGFTCSAPSWRVLVGVLLLLGAALPAVGQQRRPLLHVSQGQLPNDTSQEDQTRFSLVEHPQQGKVLRVDYAPGDSFGMGRQSDNWKPFSAIAFEAWNPANASVGLTLGVKHAGSVSYETRVDLPLTLKPGQNTIRIPLAELKNVNGSAPDLAAISHWYLAAEKEKSPTLFFGDIWLVGGAGNAPGRPSAVTTDPARLARIRAAQMPKISKPVFFATPEADAILSALEVFPADNAINQTIEDWPLHPQSQAIVASIGADKPFRYNPDMGFLLVPPNQRRVAVDIVSYPEESDPGPYPAPDDLPIEGWPAGFQQSDQPMPTLREVQTDMQRFDGDRHAIVVDPVGGKLYEFYIMRREPKGWVAAQASIFDLKSNKLRPQGWTSSDAAGLPVFPLVVRYDELQRGMVEHAMRVTVRRSRKAYVHPATHYASSLTDENLPRMGERLRLRADFDIRPFSPPVQAILKGLKKYGMLVADNGIEWAISVTPDPRIPNLHDELRKVKGSDFEVVVSPH